MATQLTTQDQMCQPAGRSVRLTPRQREIHALVAQGATDNEIACRLCLSSGYVSNEMKRVRRRLGACSRAHAVALALGVGILDAEPPRHEGA
jgi:DNA-binding CsgD family transcriptional regulator